MDVVYRMLWLVKRNQVRIPWRFGPLQPAMAVLKSPASDQGPPPSWKSQWTCLLYCSSVIVSVFFLSSFICACYIYLLISSNTTSFILASHILSFLPSFPPSSLASYFPFFFLYLLCHFFHFISSHFLLSPLFQLCLLLYFPYILFSALFNA